MRAKFFSIIVCQKKQWREMLKAMLVMANHVLSVSPVGDRYLLEESRDSVQSIFVLLFFFETKSHGIQANFKLTTSPRMTMNP